MTIQLPVELIFKGSSNRVQSAGRGGTRSTAGAVAGGAAVGEVAGAAASSAKNTSGLLKVATKSLGLLGIVAATLTALSTMLKPVLDVINIIFAVLGMGLIKLSEFLTGGQFESLAQGLENLSKFLSGEITLKDFINNIIGIILEQLKNTPLALAISDWWNNTILPNWNKLKDAITGVWDDVLKPAWDWLSEKITSIYDVVKGAFVSMINSLIDLINKIPGINIPKVSSGSTSTPRFNASAPIGSKESGGFTSMLTGGNIVVNVNSSNQATMGREIGRQILLETSIFGRK